MGGGAAMAPAAPIRDIAGVKLFAAVSGIDAKDLKSLVDDAKKTIGSGVVAIANASADGKAGVVVGVTADLTATLQRRRSRARRRARSWAARAAAAGPISPRPAVPDATALDAALAAIEETLRLKAAQ